MKEFDVHFSQGLIHYSVFGIGTTPVFAFHGFGQDGKVFLKLSERFPEYKFMALDLPFHGKTVLHDNSIVIKPEQVEEIIKLIAEEQKIKHFSIMAFSIGARFVWPLLNAFQDQIESVILIAPDSLPTNIWYRIATFNRLSRGIFKYVMLNENIMANIMRTIRALGITTRKSHLFITKSIETSIQRQRIYNTWTSMRFLEPNLSEISEIIRKGELQVHIVLGENDLLLDYKRVKRKAKRLPGVKITLIPCQHHQLLEKYASMKIEQQHSNY